MFSRPGEFGSLLSEKINKDGSTSIPTVNLTDSYSHFNGKKENISIQILPCPNGPKDDTEFLTLSLYENTTIGTEIFSPKNSRFDAFEILEGEIYPVVIDYYSGKIWLSGQLDYETMTSFKLKIRGSDSGNPLIFSDIVLDIEILDVNDNFPKISCAEVIQISDETSLMTSVAYATLKDNDSTHQEKVLKRSDFKTQFKL